MSDSAGRLDIDAVSTLLRTVGQEVLLPWRTSLRPADVSSKATPLDPDDLVTVADHEAEARLAAGLVGLVPGSQVIGEEAVHADPALMGRIGEDGPTWLVDPLDGTRNFVAGQDGFGTMVSFLRGGLAVAAWVLLPVRGELFVAESGGGAWRNGTRIRVLGSETGPRPRGAVHTRFMPAEWREVALRSAMEHAETAPDLRSAAVEYMDILCGGRDFGLYFRLLPWDHAAPALILTEGGGCCEHLDGTPYVPRSADQVTIAARDAGTADAVRRWFR